MKKIDVSPITTSIGFPVKSGTISHLQSSYQEAISSICQAITGAYDPTKVYVLSGCANTGSGANYVISAGSVFYNGEVYQVDATAFTVSGPNVAVGAIVLSYFSAANADGVQFTDGVVRNVHQVYKLVIAPGLSGAGAGNFSAFLRLNLNRPDVTLTQSGPIRVTGSFPNFTIGSVVPPHTILLMDNFVIGAVGVTGTVIEAGGCSLYTVTFSSVGTSAYHVIPVLRSLSGTSGGQESDAAVGYPVVVDGTQTDTEFQVVIKKKDPSSGTTDLTLDYTIIAI